MTSALLFRLPRCLPVLLAGHLSLLPAAGQSPNGHVEPLPLVSIQVLSNAVEHGCSPGAFAVARTGPLDLALDVDYQIGGTASNGFDYQRLPGRVTIPAGQASAPILVVPLDDRLEETPERVALTLAPRDRPFSLVVLPDSQYYTAARGGGVPEMFTAQTRWIVDHKEALNIAFVLHEGDITDQNTPLEWQRARASLGLLEGVVPCAIVPGNHDGLWTSANQTALFNQSFPVSNYLAQPWFGGVFEANRLDNSCHLFSAGGLDWLVLALEFGPRNTVLAWANQVVSNYPNRKVILLTHAHVYSDNTLQGSSPNQLWLPTSCGRQNNGVHVWEKLLRRRPGTALAFNGHAAASGTGRLVGTNDYGNRVYQMLANYQMNAGGGGGFLRLVQFFPGEDRMSVQTFSPYLEAWLRDSQNQFDYTNLGIFSNASPGYRIDPTQGSATLVIANDDPTLFAPHFLSVSCAGLPPVFTLIFDRPLERASAETVTNYFLSGGGRFVSARLAPDQRTVCLTTEADLVEGASYVVSAANIQDQAQGIPMGQPESRSFTYRARLMADDFADGDLSGYTIVDEGRLEGPSLWEERFGRLFQSSNIYGPNATALDHRQGTFAFWNAPAALAWSNYTVTVFFRNGDDDGAGLLFRYQDSSNYYKVDLDAQRNFRKLFKKVGGVETTLAEEPGGYTVGADHALQVFASGNEVTVRLDGLELFGGAVFDSSLSAGTVALYSWGSQGLSFSDLTVTPPRRFARVSFTSPAPGAVYDLATVIPVSVEALDPDQTLRQVELWDGPDSLAVFSDTPYRFDWTNAALGTHTLVAKATDDTGVTIASQMVIRVKVPDPLPILVEKPESQTIGTGSGVLFRAEALGTGPVFYQWYGNGGPIAQATNRFFFLNSVRLENAGNYWVTARDSLGSVTSAVASLVITANTNLPDTNCPCLQRLALVGLDELEAPVLLLETAPGARVTVQASASVCNDWQPLFSLTNQSRPYFFTDPAAVGAARRFYRLRPQVPAENAPSR